MRGVWLSSVRRRMDTRLRSRSTSCATRSQAERIDTVLLALTDMQGRLQGKRLTARHFLDEVVEHGAEACNYLLAVDVDMNTVDGYAMSLVGARLRRLRDGAGPRDAAAAAVARGHRAVPGRPALGRRHAGRRLAAADPARRSSSGSPNAGSRPSPAPSSSSSSSATPTSRRSARATATSRRPTSTTSTTRCWGRRGSSR